MVKLFIVFDRHHHAKLAETRACQLWLSPENPPAISNPATRDNPDKRGMANSLGAKYNFCGL
jgi:hypothetical protein